MWAKYHRRQVRTLVNLARLTRDPDTAASWKTTLAQKEFCAFNHRQAPGRHRWQKDERQP
jgi:hypothetical protein